MRVAIIWNFFCERPKQWMDIKFDRAWSFHTVPDVWFCSFSGGVRDRLGFPSIWCQKLNTVHVLSSGSSHFCLSNDVDPPVMWAHILVANELMFLLFPRYRILDIWTWSTLISVHRSLARRTCSVISVLFCESTGTWYQSPSCTRSLKTISALFACCLWSAFSVRSYDRWNIYWFFDVKMKFSCQFHQVRCKLCWGCHSRHLLSFSTLQWRETTPWKH